MYDYIIIGAGITGITLCKKLREKGISNILVLEKEKKAGGLCRTKEIDGHQLDIGGGHFFDTKHPEVLDYIFKNLPEEEFYRFPRVSKLLIGESTIDYPLESNLWQLPLSEQIQFLISVIRNGEALGKPEPQNYEEWIRWKLGNKICEEYMLPYNKKLWGVEPSEMDIDWLYKIPTLNVEEIVQYSLEKIQDTSHFPAHVAFYYPKNGGFQTIFDALYKEEKNYVKLNTPLVKLRQQQDGTWLANDSFQTKAVINTTPWNDLYDVLGEPRELKDHFSKIQYNKIVISLYELEYSHNWHWRYVADDQKFYHREFYIHNFAPHSKSRGIYLETNLKRFTGSEPFLKTEALFHYTTDAAYPIPVLGHAKAISSILDFYRPHNLFGVGRWGQHQYQNADVSIYEALKFAQKLF